MGNLMEQLEEKFGLTENQLHVQEDDLYVFDTSQEIQDFIKAQGFEFSVSCNGSHDFLDIRSVFSRK